MAFWITDQWSVQQFVQTNNKETSKVSVIVPLWGKSTSDRWIPCTKGQSRGKCFHLMTPQYLMMLNLNFQFVTCWRLWATYLIASAMVTSEKAWVMNNAWNLLWHFSWQWQQNITNNLGNEETWNDNKLLCLANIRILIHWKRLQKPVMKLNYTWNGKVILFNK